MKDASAQGLIGRYIWFLGLAAEAGRISESRLRAMIGHEGILAPLREAAVGRAVFVAVQMSSMVVECDQHPLPPQAPPPRGGSGGARGSAERDDGGDTAVCHDTAAEGGAAGAAAAAGRAASS